MGDKFFSGFERVDDAHDGDHEPSRPRQYDPDRLPFDHLSARRFEVLVWELKRAEPARTGDIVRLMQGTGERGRDVIVYDSMGVLREIIQCKRQKPRLDVTALKKELVKVALHSHLEREILGESAEPVSYQVWCPSGFTEPASDLIDRWPKLWTEDEVKSHAEQAIGTYAAFRDLSWDDVKGWVLGSFPSRIRPEPYDALVITPLVRDVREVHERFFEYRPVAPIDEVKEVLSDHMRQVGLRVLSGEDVRHIVERVEAVPARERLYFGTGYLVGMKPEMISGMSREQFDRLYKAQIEGIFKIGELVLEVGYARARELWAEYSQKAPEQHPLFIFVFEELLRFQALRLFRDALAMKIAEPAAWREYNGYALHEAIECHINWLWENLAPYVGKRPAPDESGIVHAMAHRAVTDFGTKERLDAMLTQAFETNRMVVAQAVRELEDFMPRQLLLVADTEHFLVRAKTDRSIADRLKASMDAIQPPGGIFPLASEMGTTKGKGGD